MTLLPLEAPLESHTQCCKRCLKSCSRHELWVLYLSTVGARADRFVRLPLVDRSHQLFSEISAMEGILMDLSQFIVVPLRAVPLQTVETSFWPLSLHHEPISVGITDGAVRCVRYTS